MDRYSHITPMFLSLNQEITESEIFNLKSQNLSLSGKEIKCQILVLKQKVTHWTVSSVATSLLLMCLTVGRKTVVRSGLGWIMLGPQMKRLNQEPNVTPSESGLTSEWTFPPWNKWWGVVRTISMNAPNMLSTDACVSTRRNTCAA